MSRDWIGGALIVLALGLAAGVFLMEADFNEEHLGPWLGDAILAQAHAAPPATPAPAPAPAPNAPAAR